MLVKLLGGRYQVSQILVAGECNITYLAQDTLIPDQPNALIQQLTPISTDRHSWESAQNLFLEQAKTLEKLGNHDQIVRILDYFEQGQKFYLVYELINGHPLSQELQPGCQWEEKQVLELLQEVLDILSVVHELGIIHGDIKPDNLIRRNSDQKLVLVNFASVKQVRTRLINTQKKVRATSAVGIPGYLSSEQVRGYPRPNSDIYGLGIIAIQALTGMMPLEFEEDLSTNEILWQHLVPVRKGLAAILSKMVRYHFRDRYQSVAEVLQDLETCKIDHGFREQAKVNRLKSVKKADNFGKGLLSQNPDAPLNLDRETDFPAEDPAQSVNYPSTSVFNKGHLPIRISLAFVFTAMFSTVYIVGRYLPKPTPKETLLQKKALDTSKANCKVIGPGWNIRSEPRRGETNNVVEVVPQGTVLSMTGKKKDGWIEISSPSKGWVFNDGENLECDSK